MSWLIPPKPHPLLLFSPFSLLFSFIYITHSNPPLPLLLSPVLMLPCLLFPCYYPPVPLLPCLFIPCYYPLFLCYSVSSPSVTTLCSHVTLSPLTLSLLSSSPVTTPCSFVTLSSFYPVSSLCRVKNVYLSYPQGPLLCPRQGLSSMQNMPFLPLEDALLACRTCPSWRHVFKSLIVRRLW